MESITLKVLQGHTSPETAYVVEDYPYGFSLRCKIRYWLEFKRAHGYRMVSQTTNPKLSVERWNKPKASTYCTLAVMGLDGMGHVTWAGCSMHDWARLEEFGALYGAMFSPQQKATYDAVLATRNRIQAARRLQAQREAVIA